MLTRRDLNQHATGVSHWTHWIGMPNSESRLGMTYSYLSLFQFVNYPNGMPGMLKPSITNRPRPRARAGARYAWV